MFILPLYSVYSAHYVSSTPLYSIFILDSLDILYFSLLPVLMLQHVIPLQLLLRVFSLQPLVLFLFVICLYPALLYQAELVLEWQPLTPLQLVHRLISTFLFQPVHFCTIHTPCTLSTHPPSTTPSLHTLPSFHTLTSFNTKLSLQFIYFLSTLSTSLLSLGTPVYPVIILFPVIPLHPVLCLLLYSPSTQY